MSTLLTDLSTATSLNNYLHNAMLNELTLTLVASKKINNIYIYKSYIEIITNYLLLYKHIVIFRPYITRAILG
jgi:hypothetical protein